MWAVVLFLLSAWSGPSVPSWLARWDKPAHVGLYAVLGATLGYGRRHATAPAPNWVLVGLGALYGASDEWHQAFVSGRSPDWRDWVADAIGVLLGYAVLLLVAARRGGGSRPRGGRMNEGVDVSS